MKHVMRFWCRSCQTVIRMATHNPRDPVWVATRENGVGCPSCGASLTYGAYETLPDHESAWAGEEPLLQ